MSIVLELAHVFSSQPLSWNLRQWCICSRCESYSDGCATVAGSWEVGLPGYKLNPAEEHFEEAESGPLMCNICFEQVVPPCLLLSNY
jgi:hypothetical protein